MKNTVITLLFSLISSPLLFAQNTPLTKETGEQNRIYWGKLLYKISYPVVHNLAQETLVKNMPIEGGPGTYKREFPVSHLEAVGRTQWRELPHGWHWMMTIPKKQNSVKH